MGDEVILIDTTLFAASLTVTSNRYNFLCLYNVNEVAGTLRSNDAHLCLIVPACFVMTAPRRLINMFTVDQAGLW